MATLFFANEISKFSMFQNKLMQSAEVSIRVFVSHFGSLEKSTIGICFVIGSFFKALIRDFV